MNKLQKIIIVSLVSLALLYILLPQTPQTEKKTEEVQNKTVPNEEDEEVASRDRDRYDLYDRNRDRGDWDVRTNWYNQRESYFDGNTKLNQMGPRYAPDQDYDDDPYRNNRGW